jgi:peptide/nickel transport system substrate-binding protein
MPATRARDARVIVCSALGALALLSTARCSTSTGPSHPASANITLRLGISNAPTQSAARGLQGLITNLATEVLLRVNQSGRLEPSLAKGWAQSDDGLRLTLTLRDGVQFHDGSPVDAQTVANILNDALPRSLKSAFDDVESISAQGERDVEVRFKRPSTFVADSLMGVPIRKAGTALVGTGAFVESPSNQSTKGVAEIVAFDKYYLGTPGISRIAITTYDNNRAAWADMLRNQLDMLYEVEADAIDMMEKSKTVSVYTFERPFQYVVFLNTRNPKLKARETRQALNQAIDRPGLVRDSLGGRGTPSLGPVSAHHWAFGEAGATFSYLPEAAAAKLKKRLRLTCVTLAAPPFEQMALVLKRQLQAVGVDMEIVGVPVEQVVATLSKDDFDMVLLDSESGWSVMPAYRWWHSTGSGNVMHFSSTKVDGALDRIRHAVNDSDYRSSVAEFQKAIADDPPAIFLAWSERSRAVSKRFDVQPEKGRDILASLRLFHPTTDKGNATQN